MASPVEKKRVGRRWARVLRLLLGALALWWLVAWAAARALVVNVELPQSDALVVLSGSGAYVERTRAAAELFHEGRAPRIVLTNDNSIGGWSVEQQRNPSFVERAAAELKRAGVPPERILVLPSPVNATYEEAVLLRSYAERQGLRSLLVVTSAYHSRRAWWTLRRVFRGSAVTVGIKAVRHGCAESPAPMRWWWHASGWRAVGGEYVKQLYYWLHYR
ncbi:MAG TPA: YdcF family protein [Pyrinomonadaceae bacterium]|nr:YdcF family protein [Pyrinomonadaceae bacterium]